MGAAPTVFTLAGDGTKGFAPGAGTAARFAGPYAVAVDSGGTVYVADTDNDCIRKITPAGQTTVFAGSPGNTGSADGIGNAARFYSPRGIAVDGAGNVYVTDSLNHTVRKITPAGAVTTLAGTPGNTGSADGTGAAASFFFPFGLAVDGVGDVYVVDLLNHTLRKITPAGVVSTFAGSPGMTGSTDGLGSAARFWAPLYAAADSAGNIYVSDQNNHTIRKVSPAGSVSTLAGSPGASGSVDGVGNAARFNNPAGVAVDATGNVYVSDYGNHTLRQITPAGAVTTLAGQPGTPGWVDGPGASARFYYPMGLAARGAGELALADYGNNVIRVTQPPPAPVFATLHDFAVAEGAASNNPLAFGSGGRIFGTTTLGGANNVGTIYSVQPDGSGFTVLKNFDNAGGGDGRSGVIVGNDGRLYGTTFAGGTSGGGTIFRIDADGANYTVLRQTNSADGRSLWAGLTQASDGLLYGAALVSNNWGTLFRISTDGTFFQVLRDFTNDLNGGTPQGTPTQGPDGRIYGTTFRGGQFGAGVIFAVNPDGSGYTVLHALNPATDGTNPQAGVYAAADGTLYGTTTFGGAFGSGTLYKLSPDGTGFVVLLHFSTSNPEGRNPFNAVPTISGGRLYVTAGFNGSGGAGTLISMNPNGSDVRVEISFPMGNAGNPLAGVRPGPDGRLYGTTRNGGANAQGTIFTFGNAVVVAAPQITSATSAGGGYGTPFSYQITASNAPTGFGASGLPAGLNIDANGLIAGTLPGMPGSYPITLTATNAGGTGSATLMLTVTDPVPPVIIAPSVVNAEALNANGAAVSFVATATDAISGAVTVTATPPSGSTFAIGVTSVSLVAADAAGNVANQTLLVNVADTTPPTIVAPVTVAMEASGPAGAIVNFNATATDGVSGPVAVTATPASGSTFGIGSTQVTLTAVDGAGNAAAKTLLVQVTDTTPPVITAPAVLAAEATGAAGAVVTFTATANDSVSGARTVLATPASGSTFGLGSTTVTLTAQDAAGNIATRALSVQVNDTTPPVLSLPANLIVDAAGPTSVSFSAGATDLVSGAVGVALTPASGSTFPLGTTTVNASATDGRGNLATGSFTVTVRDTAAPAFASLTASTSSLWPGNHKMVAVTLTAVASDAGGLAAVKIINVTSNEPDNGLGDGDTAGDIQVTGDLTLNLRAERAGNGDGRVYTITVEARDVSGNTSRRAVTVSVPKSQGGK